MGHRRIADEWRILPENAIPKNEWDYSTQFWLFEFLFVFSVILLVNVNTFLDMNIKVLKNTFVIEQ